MKKARLAIVAALADEIRITRSKMQIDESAFVRPAKIMRGTYEGIPLILVQSGVGMEAMTRAVSYCLDTYKPALCLNVGFCGGAAPDVSVGDLVIADRVVDARSGSEHVLEKKLVDEACALCEARDMRYRRGGIAMVDRVVSDPHDKAFVGTSHGVHALDMESQAFAAACIERGVDCLVVRAVFDAMDLKLPNLEGIVDEEGETDMYGAFKKLMRKPKDILKVPKLEYCAVQAREAIARFIEAWLQAHNPQ